MIPRNKIERGKFLWKQEWYSICSAHRDHNSECDMCTTGRWNNVLITRISSFVYKHFPKFWRWWVNLPFFKLNFVTLNKRK
jgi:Cys-tRNA synthase (O-phospho-L-seryl-tRNA:Cys-tRNA synthase)